MGVLSKFHRYREAGEQANVNNVERFGEPEYSLFTSTKVLTLHHEISITDDRDQVVYQAKSKFPSLHDKTDVYDAAGNHVSHIERKFFTLHERHVVRDVTNIEGLGWQLQGNIVGLNFELYDADGNIIAVISQKMISLHDKYCVDIYQPEEEKTVVTILVTLQHMIRDRENSAAASSSGSND